MKYCCTETERVGTCYHEFQKGKFDGTFWHKDSLLISDDNLFELHLGDIFKSVVKTYDEYGETEITQEEWNEIYGKACELGGEIMIAINEINSWARNTYETYKVFTILGI